MTDDGKEKKMNIDFEPFKPINTSLYLCDNKFHTEALNELLEADNKCAQCVCPVSWVCSVFAACLFVYAVCLSPAEGLAAQTAQPQRAAESCAMARGGWEIGCLACSCAPFLPL
jgi:hypothetical protein